MEVILQPRAECHDVMLQKVQHGLQLRSDKCTVKNVFLCCIQHRKSKKYTTNLIRIYFSRTIMIPNKDFLPA